MAIGDTIVHKRVAFFSFELLRKFFQTVLLRLLENKIYKDINNGFYVRAPKQKDSSSKEVIEYILRYCGRLAFASYRILNIHDKIKTMIGTLKIPFYRSLNKFRMLMIKSFNIDLFICDKCGSFMEFHELLC